MVLNVAITLSTAPEVGWNFAVSVGSMRLLSKVLCAQGISESYTKLRSVKITVPGKIRKEKTDTGSMPAVHGSENLHV